jgi:hypothetical protein
VTVSALQCTRYAWAQQRMGRWKLCTHYNDLRWQVHPRLSCVNQCRYTGLHAQRSVLLDPHHAMSQRTTLPCWSPLICMQTYILTEHRQVMSFDITDTDSTRHVYFFADNVLSPRCLLLGHLSSLCSSLPDLKDSSMHTHDHRSLEHPMGREYTGQQEKTAHQARRDHEIHTFWQPSDREHYRTKQHRYPA